MTGIHIKAQRSATKYERQQFLKRYKTPKRKTPMEKIIETLARGWIVCDPNRQPCDPDAPIAVEGGTMNGQPEWTWFVPRAQALVKFLGEQGYEVRKKS